MAVISYIKKALEATFYMEDRGRLHWFLGLRMRQRKGKATVDQKRYKEIMIERFQMNQCKPSRTPAGLNLKLQTAQNLDEDVDQRIYRSLVGSLLYLAKQARPDIMFTFNILSRHMNAPTNQHWMCGKRLLRYLLGSKGLKLNWRGQPKLYQTLPKRSHAQEEQAHRDKLSLHSGQDGGWDYFTSLRSYRQNGSGHLHKVLTRSESGNNQSSFDGNRLYAVSSSLSGGVRISIKL